MTLTTALVVCNVVTLLTQSCERSNVLYSASKKYDFSYFSFWYNLYWRFVSCIVDLKNVTQKDNMWKVNLFPWVLIQSINEKTNWNIV